VAPRPSKLSRAARSPSLAAAYTASSSCARSCVQLSSSASRRCGVRPMMCIYNYHEQYKLARHIGGQPTPRLDSTLQEEPATCACASNRHTATEVAETPFSSSSSSSSDANS
jgi:hypothetical protein